MRQEEQQQVSYWSNPDLKFNVRHIRKKLEQKFKAPSFFPVGSPWTRHDYLLDPQVRVHRRHNSKKLDQLFKRDCGQYLDFNQGKSRWMPERYRNEEDRQFWHNLKQWAEFCKVEAAAKKIVDALAKERELDEALGGEHEYEVYHEHPGETGYCGDDLPTEDDTYREPFQPYDDETDTGLLSGEGESYWDDYYQELELYGGSTLIEPSSAEEYAAFMDAWD